MKKKTIVYRFFLFLVFFILLFLVVSEVLKDKRIVQEYDASAKVKGFYEDKEDTLDFVFVGSSQLFADIAPAVLFSEYGITSYDFCANEQPLWISYYYIKEALKLPGNKILMKAASKLSDVKKVLKEQGQKAWMIENCGMEEEKIYHSVEEMPEKATYYTTLLVKEEIDKNS